MNEQRVNYCDAPDPNVDVRGLRRGLFVASCLLLFYFNRDTWRETSRLPQRVRLISHDVNNVK